jgi:putative SbcD/Mre11-related phosphoesterase
MRLNKDIEILDGLPILHMTSINAIVCSDIHLGYESRLARNGVFAPKKNLNDVKKMVKSAADMSGADRIIITGDIKNDFSRVELDEFNEIREFARFSKEEAGMKEIVFVKGNHDNFLDRLAKPLGITMHQEEMAAGKTVFAHGDALPKKEWDTLVFGHVHPAIAVYNGLGVKERIKCFLYGKTMIKRHEKEVIVIPALTPFASGVDVNIGDVSAMSPIFKNIVHVDTMRALCVGEGETLDFGTVYNLRILARV